MISYNLNFTIMVAVFVGLFGVATVGHTKECVTSVDDTVLFRSGEINYIGSRVVDFLAVIGSRDLSNSKGKPLFTLGAILQQDRANYHKSNRADITDDIKDGDDRYFTTLDRRQILSKARYYYDCFMDKQDIIELHNQVLSGKFATLWVVLFRQPDGRLAVYATPVG